MKKIICVVLLVALMATLLTACGVFECDLCGENKFGIKHEESLFGETITYCDDCKEDLEDLNNMFSSLY